MRIFYSKLGCYYQSKCRYIQKNVTPVQWRLLTEKFFLKFNTYTYLILLNEYGCLGYLNTALILTNIFKRKKEKNNKIKLLYINHPV